MLATQLMAQLRRTFGVDPGLRALFENPTIASLAAAMISDPAKQPRITRIAEIMKKISDASEEEVTEVLLDRKSPAVKSANTQ